jgi:predicted nucleic acid-binding protein
MRMLVDTDVLIWHLRGFLRATQRLDQLPKLTISAITWLELLQGFRNRAEMLAVQKSLEMRNAERLPITPAITERATALMETLALSHSLRLGDALIARHCH